MSKGTIQLDDLRNVTEDDIERALTDSYVREDFANVDRAKLLEFWNRVLDVIVGPRDD